MAMNLEDMNSRSYLARAIRRSYTEMSPDRIRRADLLRIYADRNRLASLFADDDDRKAYLNLFALFVRGQEVTLSYRSPRFAVSARTAEGKGFDKKIEQFLEKYVDLLDFKTLVRQWAVDSAFGRVAAKVIQSIAPKGIYSPVAPRAFRLNPDHLIVDQSAASLENATYICDMYFVDLDEAKAHPYFDPEIRQTLAPWTLGNISGSEAFPYPTGDHQLFATLQTRLIDVYIPSLGIIATWPCPNDQFTHIANTKPLQVLPAKANPYVIHDPVTIPDCVEVLSRLGLLRPLNMLANDLFYKSARQARQQLRSIVAMQGDEQDVQTMLRNGDGEAAFLSNPQAAGIFQVPGPDQGVLGMANMAADMFSNHAGNLQTALGIAPGAGTARQTQALLGQISQSQAVDRLKFEYFLAEVGKRLATLAFYDENLVFNFAQQVPGMKIWLNAGWGPPHVMGRIGEICDYSFEVVPYSTTYRGPEEKLKQLTMASQLIGQMMMMKAQGAPINMDAVIADIADSLDLIPNLQDWWSGQMPTPQQQGNQIYQSMAQPAQGTQISYQSNSGLGNPVSSAIPQNEGGMTNALAS